ncbi:hypothetical protein PMIT1342_00340 [Prochlorococcus marinus str. MIT 1342]|nr:hypothetical protein [Prochlorococcus marinus]KZR83548.1 hypothetical protein PMIT1342_00340 [Prochlorococcus marinus str. MIT 1342]
MEDLVQLSLLAQAEIHLLRQISSFSLELRDMRLLTTDFSLVLAGMA